jgi:hypothetical protein
MVQTLDTDISPEVICPYLYRETGHKVCPIIYRCLKLCHGTRYGTGSLTERSVVSPDGTTISITTVHYLGYGSNIFLSYKGIHFQTTGSL